MKEEVNLIDIWVVVLIKIKGGIVVKEIDDGRRVCGYRSVLGTNNIRKIGGLYSREFLGSLIPYEVWDISKAPNNIWSLREKQGSRKNDLPIFCWERRL